MLVCLPLSTHNNTIIRVWQKPNTNLRDSPRPPRLFEMAAWTEQRGIEWETLWLCVRKIPTMMVRPYDGQTEQQHRQHQAVDGLFNLFTKANHDLTLLHNKLQREFQQLYPDNVFFVQIHPSHFDSTVLFSLLRTEVFSFGIFAGKPPNPFFTLLSWFTFTSSKFEFVCGFSFSGKSHEACGQNQENSGGCVILEWAVPWTPCSQAGICT